MDNDERICDSAASGQIASGFGTNDAALAQAPPDPGEEAAERTLADTGLVDSGATEDANGKPIVTWVYFVRAVQMNRIKIGITSSMQSRMSAYRTHWPDELQLMGTVRCGSRPAALMLEQWLLGGLRKYHLHGEWFDATDAVFQRIGVTVAGYQDWDSVIMPRSEADALIARIKENYNSVYLLLDQIGLTMPYAREVAKNLLLQALRIAVSHCEQPRTLLLPCATIKYHPVHGVALAITKS